MKPFELVRTPGRRRLLRGLAALPLLAMLSARPAAGMTGSFLQLWPSHLELTPAQWRGRLRRTRRLGCDELVLQWVGMTGGAMPWQASKSTMLTLLDAALQSGLRVQVGLPYDERWWKAIASPDPSVLQTFMVQAGEAGQQFMRSASFTQHPAFSGWYIPYEVEQFNWATSERQHMLAKWLAGFVAARGHAVAPGVSTYYSRLPGGGTLSTLWSTILDHANVRPMIQDGVGVAGMENYDALAPLARTLRMRGAPFDLIVELFEERPSAKTDGTTFNAVAADFDRVQIQLNIARRYGAARVLGFAADPWVLGDTPEAMQLHAAWRRTYG